MKEQYPIEFNEIAKNFLDGVMNEFNMTYPTALMSDREVSYFPPNICLYVVKRWRELA